MHQATARPQQELSARFGRLLPARPRPRKGPTDTGIDTWERGYPPDSLIQLNDETAPRLQQFMKQVEAGCRIGLTLMRDVIFIWLIDKDGRIVLALEELVIDSRPLGVPKFQELSKAVAVLREKLGHPSLVQGEPARIAGEIRYLRATPTRTPLWIINNISWRYGLYEDRTEAQLKEVAAEFQRRGITLQAEFERPH